MSDKYGSHADYMDWAKDAYSRQKVIEEPSGYHKPTIKQRRLSMIDKKDYETWFQQIWNIHGASTKNHPVPFPLELAYRLIRMFSFVGDTVPDPFCGTGTTMLATIRANRNSIGVVIDPEYCQMALRRLRQDGRALSNQIEIKFEI